MKKELEAQEKTKNEIFPYKTLSRKTITSFAYKPNSAKINKDIEFSKNILSLLDKNLATLNFDVTITKEIILATKSNDTMQFVIFDYIGNRKKAQSQFNNCNFIDDFLGVYKSPYSCKFFLTQKSLCVITREGIEMKIPTNNIDFLDYIDKNTHKRLTAKQP